MESENNQPVPGSIRFVNGPFETQVFPIDKPIVTIGRDPDNDIAIVSDQSVSRHHAQLIWQNDAWTIEKLSPQNMLTVNGSNVQQARLNDSDRVGLGLVTAFLFLIQTPDHNTDKRLQIHSNETYPPDGSTYESQRTGMIPEAALPPPQPVQPAQQPPLSPVQPPAQKSFPPGSAQPQVGPIPP